MHRRVLGLVNQTRMPWIISFPVSSNNKISTFCTGRGRATCFEIQRRSNADVDLIL